MNNEVKQMIDKEITDIIDNYLNKKKNIDRQQEIKGVYKWKLL